jgi:predicted NAD/FAD-binding protein
MSDRLRIAIIGAGISGLTAAYVLSRRHEVTLFEANDYVGGHTNTINVDDNGNRLGVDTGFIVFNERNYPHFTRILTELRVPCQDTTMSFSVRDEREGLEYNGTSINALFAQRRNLLSLAFYRMLSDILRFNRQARRLLEDEDNRETLGGFLDDNRFSREFQEQYLIPMGAALWSAQPDHMLEFPARYFVRFFHQHGMLGLGNRPQWRVISGGSRNYVKRMTASFEDRVRCGARVTSVRRCDSGVDVTTDAGQAGRFDRVVIAAHSDQALAMLDDPSEVEREVLGAIPYQENEAILHTDPGVLPRARRAWACWNYHIPRARRDRVAVTYNMNLLQRLDTETIYNVTLNYHDAVDEARIIKRISYHHPMYTLATIGAQKRKSEIDGVRETFYCGAYWGFGFHEDGVRSALDVCAQMGEGLSS